ncbi:hypothetical protein NONI108955_17200 [Nocardia ninae]|uniref:Uncharacterized protein n=1 Tax=Nocardia ninae NBRC 108245 TaxID=1210091 RepID=A0A511MGF0_9NOCA|nr:hypothetical protein [Nocardia ninae]GEM39649.1 hypothetical protein NN4_41680 [Nocardia ninae NBRC 108245]
MSDGKMLWEIKLGVLATEAEAKQLTDQICHLLCPNPDHTPPCPIPWAIGLDSESEMEPERQEQYEDIREQYRIESGDTAIRPPDKP